MSQYVGEYKSFFESPAGSELLDFIRSQIDAEHAKAEAATDPLVIAGHTKTASAYRSVSEHIETNLLERKPNPYK